MNKKYMSIALCLCLMFGFYSVVAQPVSAQQSNLFSLNSLDSALSYVQVITQGIGDINSPVVVGIVAYRLDVFKAIPLTVLNVSLYDSKGLLISNNATMKQILNGITIATFPAIGISGVYTIVAFVQWNTNWGSVVTKEASGTINLNGWQTLGLNVDAQFNSLSSLIGNYNFNMTDLNTMFADFGKNVSGTFLSIAGTISNMLKDNTVDPTFDFYFVNISPYSSTSQQNAFRASLNMLNKIGISWSMTNVTSMSGSDKTCLDYLLLHYNTSSPILIFPNEVIPMPNAYNASSWILHIADFSCRNLATIAFFNSNWTARYFGWSNGTEVNYQMGFNRLLFATVLVTGNQTNGTTNSIGAYPNTAITDGISNWFGITFPYFQTTYKTISDSYFSMFQSIAIDYKVLYWYYENPIVYTLSNTINKVFVSPFNNDTFNGYLLFGEILWSCFNNYKAVEDKLVLESNDPKLTASQQAWFANESVVLNTMWVDRDFVALANEFVVIREYMHTLSQATITGMPEAINQAYDYLNGTQGDVVTMENGMTQANNTVCISPSTRAFLNWLETSNERARNLTSDPPLANGGGGGGAPSTVVAVANVNINLYDISCSATVSGGTAPYTYMWNFGDGGKSSLATPTHHYLVAGMFSVSLTVSDSLGAGGVSQKWINITGLDSKGEKVYPYNTNLLQVIGYNYLPSFTTMTGSGTTNYPTGWSYSKGDGSASTSIVSDEWGYNALYQSIPSGLGHYKDNYYVIGHSPPTVISFAVKYDTNTSYTRNVTISVVDLTTNQWLTFEFAQGSTGFGGDNTHKIVYINTVQNVWYNDTINWLGKWIMGYGALPDMTHQWAIVFGTGYMINDNSGVLHARFEATLSGTCAFSGFDVQSILEQLNYMWGDVSMTFKGLKGQTFAGILSLLKNMTTNNSLANDRLTNQLNQTIGGTVSNVVSSMVGFITYAENMLQQDIAIFAGIGIGLAVLGITSAMASGIGVALLIVSTLIVKWMADNSIAIIKSLWKGIVGALINVVTMIVRLLTYIMQQIMVAINTLITQIEKLILNITSAISDMFSKIVACLNATIGYVVSSFNVIKNWTLGSVTLVRNSINGIIKEAVDLETKLTGVSGFYNYVDPLRDVFSGIVSGERLINYTLGQFGLTSSLFKQQVGIQDQIQQVVRAFGGGNILIFGSSPDYSLNTQNVTLYTTVNGSAYTGSGKYTIYNKNSPIVVDSGSMTFTNGVGMVDTSFLSNGVYALNVTLANGFQISAYIDKSNAVKLQQCVYGTYEFTINPIVDSGALFDVIFTLHNLRTANGTALIDVKILGAYGWVSSEVSNNVTFSGVGDKAITLTMSTNYFIPSGTYTVQVSVTDEYTETQWSGVTSVPLIVNGMSPLFYLTVAVLAIIAIMGIYIFLKQRSDKAQSETIKKIVLEVTGSAGEEMEENVNE